VTRKVDLQFRAEVFNIFNTVNFNAPNSTQASAQFGRITSPWIHGFCSSG
jgi:hypothetical protein